MAIWKIEDSFAYQAFDGELYSNLALVSINIDSVNTAPMIVEIPPQVTAEDTPLEIEVEVTDGENDSVVIEIAGVPLHGVVDSTTTSDGFNFTVLK